MNRNGILCALFFLLAGSVFPLPALAQLPELAQSPSYQVSGQVGWLLRYGLGDGRGLIQKGYSRGLFFSQSIGLDADISVHLQRPISGMLSLAAHLDNQQPEFLQSLHMRWQAETWQVEFGDFPMGRPGSLFASSSRLLKGFRADWHLSDRVTLSGIFSQVSGILQTRTFRGNTVEEKITFAFHRPDQPLIEEPYLRNLRGLEHFALGSNYVEGFTRVRLAFRAEPALSEILRAYDLGYLFETIQRDPEAELDSAAQVVVFTQDGYFLALKSEFLSLMRERLHEYIDDYNLAQGLTGDERKEYPFSEGTDFERAFLERLSEQVSLRVDSLSFTAKDSARRRFYSLNRPDIQEDSVKIEIKRDDEFLEINDPRLAEYRYRIHAEQGVLEFDFPPEFFENPKSAVRVTYAYQTSAGAYVLGLSILKGSEKVYLNGNLLRPSVDYLIEYETGFLILLKEIGSDDVLRVEYELARGALGVGGDYSQNFGGLSLSYRPFDGLQLHVDLLQSYESPRPGLVQETVATMPNTHTVLGLSGRLEVGETLQGDFDLGFTINRFPPDDNLRAHLPNSIHVIRSLEHGGRELILFGHRNGLLVYDGRAWSEYGPVEGLAGLTVYDIAVAPNQLAFATLGGVSLLKLDAGNPLASFARRANWQTLNLQDGLPSSTIYAVLFEGDTLWVGTEKGLAQAPLSGLFDEQDWKIYNKTQYPEMLSDRILRLVSTQGLLYLGTDKGLMILDPKMERFEIIEDLRGIAIHDLIADGPVVYAATDGGVRAVEGARGFGWPVAHMQVNALAIYQDQLWYSTPQGLFGLSHGLIAETRGRAITALGGSREALWAGEEATSDEYELWLYELTSALESVRVHPQEETRLDGRARDRYVDVPAEEHTDYGWIGRFALKKQLGPLELQGTLEGISPYFSPIGTLDRQDHLKLTLSAVYPLSAFISLSARHEEGLSELFRSSSQTLRDTVGLRFGPESGPAIDLDYTLQRVDEARERAGFERLQRAYTLSASQKFLDNRLALRVGYGLGQIEDLRRPSYSSIESELSGEATFQALPGLTLRLGYRQPTQWRFGQSFGDHRLNWGAHWSTGFALGALPFSLEANYRGRSELALQGSRNTLDQDAGLLVRGSPLPLGGATLLPQTSFSLRSIDPWGTNASWQLSGEGTLQARFADFSASLFYKKGFLTHKRSQLDRLQDNARISLEYLGIASLQPALEFSGSLETLIHPLSGRKTTGQYEVALHLLWQTALLQADLLLSRRVEDSDRRQTISYLLQQSLQSGFLPGFSPRLDFQAEYTRGQEHGESIEELLGEVTLAGDFTLIEEWGSTLSATYLFGLNAVRPQESYHSFALTVQIGRAFAFF